MFNETTIKLLFYTLTELHFIYIDPLSLFGLFDKMCALSLVVVSGQFQHFNKHAYKIMEDRN